MYTAARCACASDLLRPRNVRAAASCRVVAVRARCSRGTRPTFIATVERLAAQPCALCPTATGPARTTTGTPSKGREGTWSCITADIRTTFAAGYGSMRNAPLVGRLAVLALRCLMAGTSVRRRIHRRVYICAGYRGARTGVPQATTSMV